MSGAQRLVAADERARPAAVAGAALERRQPADLAEILERVLSTGIVIAGEIRIDLLDIELLTIRLRLVITSLDRAEEVGLDWWRGDAWYTARRPDDPSLVELVADSGNATGAEEGGETAENESERAGRAAAGKRPEHGSPETASGSTSRRSQSPGLLDGPDAAARAADASASGDDVVLAEAVVATATKRSGRKSAPKKRSASPRPAKQSGARKSTQKSATKRTSSES